MSRSERAFNQVKSILGKLDRRIDEARARRMLPADAPIPASAAAPVQAPPTPPKPAAAVTAPKSVYGRAKPLHPSPFQTPARWET